MNFLDAFISLSFLHLAILTAIVSGAVCGLIGPIVVTRKLSSVTGGIAHSVIGGMGLFVWLGQPPLIGALFSALVVALALSAPQLQKIEDADARVQILWSAGVALGVLFISLTPGYGIDLMSYLFGNLLLATNESLLLSCAVLVLSLVLLAGKYKVIESLCFDEEFSRVIGLPIRTMNMVLYCLIALAVVVLIQSVGLVLVISLMTLPASIALVLSRSLLQMIIFSVLMNWGFSLLGLFLSFHFDLPTGSTIILCAVFFYSIFHLLRYVMLKRPFFFASSLRRSTR